MSKLFEDDQQRCGIKLAIAAALVHAVNTRHQVDLTDGPTVVENAFDLAELLLARAEQEP